MESECDGAVSRLLPRPGPARKKPSPESVQVCDAGNKKFLIEDILSRLTAVVFRQRVKFDVALSLLTSGQSALFLFLAP